MTVLMLVKNLNSKHVFVIYLLLSDRGFFLAYHAYLFYLLFTSLIFDMSLVLFVLYILLSPPALLATLQKLILLSHLT